MKYLPGELHYALCIVLKYVTNKDGAVWRCRQGGDQGGECADKKSDRERPCNANASSKAKTKQEGKLDAIQLHSRDGEASAAENVDPGGGEAIAAR